MICDLFEFTPVIKKTEGDTTWYILNLKSQHKLTELYTNDSLSDSCVKELTTIRKIVIDSLVQTSTLFSKKPTTNSLLSITPPYYVLPHKNWSPVVKWNNSDLPKEFRVELVSIYISRSLIVPLFAQTEYKEDVIDLEWSSSIHPDLEEIDCSSLECETELNQSITLRNLKKERLLAKDMFKQAYEAEEEFILKYGELLDDESTFSDSESDSSSD